MSINIIDTNYLSLLKTYKAVKSAKLNSEVRLFESVLEGLEQSLFKNTNTEFLMINLKSIKRTGTDIKILIEDLKTKERDLPTIVFYQDAINKSALDQAWNLKSVGQLLPGELTCEKLQKVINLQPLISEEMSD